jgi:hypothetical protein
MAITSHIESLELHHKTQGCDKLPFQQIITENQSFHPHQFLPLGWYRSMELIPIYIEMNQRIWKMRWQRSAQVIVSQQQSLKNRQGSPIPWQCYECCWASRSSCKRRFHYQTGQVQEDHKTVVIARDSLPGADTTSSISVTGRGCSRGHCIGAIVGGGGGGGEKAKGFVEVLQKGALLGLQPHHGLINISNGRSQNMMMMVMEESNG